MPALAGKTYTNCSLTCNWSKCLHTQNWIWRAEFKLRFPFLFELRNFSKHLSDSFKVWVGCSYWTGPSPHPAASRTFPSPTARAKPCVGTNTSTMLRQQRLGAKSCTTWDLEDGKMICIKSFPDIPSWWPPNFVAKKTCFDHIQLSLWFQEGLAYTKQPVSGSVGSGFGRNSMCWPFQLLVLLSNSESFCFDAIFVKMKTSYTDLWYC